MDNHRNCHILLRVDDADGQALFPSLPTKGKRRMKCLGRGFLIESSAMMSSISCGLFILFKYPSYSWEICWTMCHQIMHATLACRQLYQCYRTIRGSISPWYRCLARLSTSLPLGATKSKLYWGTTNHGYFQPTKWPTLASAVPGGINAADGSTQVYHMSEPNRRYFLSDLSMFHRQMYQEHRSFVPCPSWKMPTSRVASFLPVVAAVPPYFTCHGWIWFIQPSMLRSPQN